MSTQDTTDQDRIDLVQAEALASRAYADAARRMASVSRKAIALTPQRFEPLSELPSDEVAESLEARLQTEFAGDGIPQQLVDSGFLTTLIGMSEVGAYKRQVLTEQTAGDDLEADDPQAEYLSENAHLLETVSVRLATVLRIIAANAGGRHPIFRSTAMLLWANIGSDLNDPALRFAAFRVAAVYAGSSHTGHELAEHANRDIDEIRDLIASSKKSTAHQKSAG